MRSVSDNANLVVGMCPPFMLLAASTMPIISWFGRFAIAIAVIATVVSLLNEKRLTTEAVLIGATVACLIAVGLVPYELNLIALERMLLVSILGIFLLEYRIATAGPISYFVSLALVSLMLMINFEKKTVFALVFKQKSWVSHVIDDPNTFGLCCAVLTIFTFKWSRVVSGSPLRFFSYLLCLVSIFLVAASGSRTALLSIVAFFAVYLIGKLSSGSKAWLRGSAVAALIAVPVVTFGYPAALGSHFNFLPQPNAKASSAKILSYPACVPTLLEVCAAVAGAPKNQRPEQREGGPLGLNKEISSGREVLWPTIIEMGGQSPIWGHGLAATPGSYLAPPLTGLHAHNGFLQVYYQFGIIGVALYLLLWCLLFVRAIGIADVRDRSAAVAVLCAASVVETFDVVFIQYNVGIGTALAILATTGFASVQTVWPTRDPSFRPNQLDVCCRHTTSAFEGRVC